MTITLYGLKNCDTCRKARRWLDNAGIQHAFVDVRDEGVTTERLTQWLQHVDWNTLLNRRSRAWRELPESEQADLDQTRAITLMQSHPTLIKRPVLDTDDTVLIGFSSTQYEQALANS